MKLKQTVQHSFLDLDEATHEFMLHQQSSGHSPCTITHYKVSLRHLKAALDGEGIEDMEDIKPKHLRQMLLTLQAKYKPKTVHGIASDLRAFFAFHQRENNIESPMARVDMPKQPQEILPAFTPEEVQAMLKATEGRDPTTIRNRLIILVLLDSGVRLCELATLKLGDIDPKTGIFKVMGKGRKERLTRLSALTLKTYGKYLRFHEGREGDPLWLGKYGAMTYHGLAQTVEMIGKWAKVHAHPHKFRRTCALTMLRNGADVFSVQHLLGHSDLTILRRYLAQTQNDYLQAHIQFSPVQSLTSKNKDHGARLTARA